MQRYVYYQMHNFFAYLHALLGRLAPGRFSRSRLRGLQARRVDTTAQVWVPAGLRGAHSGRSKSRDVASDHGIAFPQARANQIHGSPQIVIRTSFFLFVFPPLCCCF